MTQPCDYVLSWCAVVLVGVLPMISDKYAYKRSLFHDEGTEEAHTAEDYVNLNY